MSREGRSRWGLNQRFVIGKQDNPMMERWRLIQTPWFGVYVHFIYREDLDPVPHDHPWNFFRMVLKGGYVENYFEDPTCDIGFPQRIAPFRPLYFSVRHAHRIVVVKPGTVSLVIVGRKKRVWNFYSPEIINPDPKTYHTLLVYPTARKRIDYRDALGLRPSEGVSGEGVRDS